MRSIQATNPDIVFAAAYPPDTVGLVRAANEIGLNTKIFGGTMIGLLATTFKVQLGPLINRMVASEVYIPAPSFAFPGVREMLARYQAQAPSQGLDPLGYGFAPFGYAGAQTLGIAVEATKSLDPAKLAEYMHGHPFSTVVGTFSFGADGEWSHQRVLATQFHDVIANNVDQFRDVSRETILWPPEYKTGDMIYPYSQPK